MSYHSPGNNPFKTLPKDAPQRARDNAGRGAPAGPGNFNNAGPANNFQAGGGGGGYQGGFRGRGGYNNRGGMRGGFNPNYGNSNMNAFNNNMGGFNNPMGGGGFGGAGGFNRGGGMNRGAPGMGAMRGGRGGMMGGPGMNGMGMGGMPNMGMGGMPNMGMNMMGGMGKYPHVAAILFSMRLSLHVRGASLGSCGDLALCFSLGVSSCSVSSLFVSLFCVFFWFVHVIVVLYLVLYCVATNIYLCFQDSTACLTSSTQASSAVETRAVTAETKPAAEAATGSTLTERRELAASRFRQRFPQCEPQIDCLSVLLRREENRDIRPMSFPGSRTMAATASY